jgi:CHAD domain-containing protein
MKKRTNLKWDPAEDAAGNARRVLPKLVRQYFSQGRKAAVDGVSEADLHRFRLATKRLRYTLEMFAELYGPGIETKLKQVRRVQQVLGEVQDCEMLRSLDGAKEHPRLAVWVERRIARKKAEFRRLWSAEFGDEASQRRWLTYLERYART